MFYSIRARFRKEICPYCFDEYWLRNTPFRCSSPAERCSPERDEVLYRKWDDGTPVGRVLPVGGLRWKERCSACGHESRKRLCPHCHMELPRTTGRFPNLIFAVIGAKQSGKSHYLAVLIDQLKKHVGPAFDMVLEPLNDHTINRYREQFYDPVFREGRVIQGTRSALAERGVQMPLVYTLAFSGKNLFGQRIIRAVVTLVFFDTAGEDLDYEDRMSIVNKYIYRSDGIIILLDPLQLSRVRDQLNGSAALPERNSETSDIITRTTNLILAGRDLASDSMVPTPLAVAFSKFDALEPLIDPQFQIKATSSHQGGYDHDDFEAVSSEMQALLEEWDDLTIVNQVRTRYRRFGYFGLSALGCNPHNDSKIPRVIPHRVEDPFLWLLYEHGLVEADR